MRWLIDGYNVIRRDPDLKSREAESLPAGRTALLHLLAPIARRSPDQFIVVFDGARPSGGAAGGQVRVVFSRPPEKADDVLIRLAKQWGDGAIVVTSDRTIQDAARRARSAVLSVDEFLSALSREDAAESPGDDDERPRTKRGNPRRLSKSARATRRARERLRLP